MGPTAESHTLNARLLRFRSSPEQENPQTLARDLLEAKRYGDARGVALAAQGADGSDGALLLIEGRAWFMERDLVRAQAALLKAAKVDPRSADVFRWLGEVLLKRGDPPRAARALNRALDLNPDYTEAQVLARRAESLSRVAASVPVDPPEPEPEPEIDVELAEDPVQPPPATRVVAGLPPPPPLAEAFTVPSASASQSQEPSRPPRPVRPPLVSGVGGQPSPFPPRPAGIPSPVGLSAPAAAGEAHLWGAGEDEPTQAFRTSSAGIDAPEPFEDLSEGDLDEQWQESEAGVLGAPSVAGTRSVPGSLSSPGSTTAPGITSAGRISVPGTLPTPRTSAAGQLSSPGLVSSPGTQSSAGMHASPGALSSPGMHSSPGRLSSPGSLSAFGSSAGHRAAPASEAGVLDSPRDVEIEFPPDMTDTTPGVGELAPGDWSTAHDPGWDVSSPALDLGPHGDHALGSALLLNDEDRGAPAQDLELGADAGRADDAEQVLATLREHGIFEPTEHDGDGEFSGEVTPEAAVWAAPHEVARSGSRMRGALIGVWAVTLTLFAAGYFGWQEWVGSRHVEASELVTRARAAAFDSDYAKLVDAERMLRAAREKHARSTEVPRYELFVHTQRVLENGSRDLSSLRSAIARAERLGADERYQAAARAVLATYSGAGKEADALREAAVKAAAGEGELLYIVGRLEQRQGLPGATAHLQTASAAAPELRAATIALGEIAHDAGARSDALARFDAVVSKQPDHLRAGLWRSFLTADEQALDSGLAALDKLARRVAAGAPIDRVLWGLSRARLLTRKGDGEAASAAVAEALAGGADEPRLLAMVAEEARRTGQLSMAQNAAGRAVAAAPSILAYRVLLARVMIERGDGSRALDLLAKLPAEDPEVLMMRAQAALQSGETDALQDGLAALEQYPKDGDAELSVRALELRIKAKLEPTRSLLREARRLVKRAPGDPLAARALGEIALELRESRDATEALEQLVISAPDDADGHFLLARARRLSGDSAGAEQAYQRALELAPAHGDAMVGLGGLLLDSGKYAEADALYQKLVASGQGVLFGRLGRVEALLGLGRLEDAQVQLAGLPENLRDGRAARETGARLALARGKPGEALTLLRPLTEAEGVQPATLALYGDALYSADQVNVAAAVYERALDADGTFPEALVGRAQVHLRAERPKDALELLDEAKQALETRLRGPEVQARLLTLLGHAYVQREKRGDLDRARVALLRAIELPGAPAEAHFWLGEASGGRRTPEAAAAFKRYLELQPQGRFVERAKRALGPML